MYQYESQIGTTTAVLQDLGGDASATTAIAIGIVLAIAVFLLGVGFGWRLLTRRALGRKI